MALSDKEITEVTRLLKKLEPGYLPFSIFLQVSRLAVTNAIEIIPVRFINNELEILFIKREKNDPFWPNLWHTPGTILRPNDTKGNFLDAFKRIINSELRLNSKNYNPHFIHYFFNDNKRGSSMSFVYYIEINEEVQIGKWFNYKNLPKDLVGEQMPMIDKCINIMLNRDDIIKDSM